MNITIAESVVMKLLWASRRPMRSEQLVSELGPSQGWSETTTRTLLSRLVKKGMVAAEPDGGRKFLYRPLVSQADYQHAESKGLIERLFDGQLGPFVAQFSAREKLSPADIAQLKRLLDELDDGD